eukprot:8800545-Pyramimonas_sp.AAC.1
MSDVSWRVITADCFASSLAMPRKAAAAVRVDCWVSCCPERRKRRGSTRRVASGGAGTGSAASR